MDQEQKLENKNDQAPANPYAVPAAIVLAGTLIAGAVLYTSFQPARTASVKDSQDAGGPAVAENVMAVGPRDHIFGNADAQVNIVEFSDLECPWERAEALKPDIYKSSLLSHKEKVIEEKVEK